MRSIFHAHHWTFDRVRKHLEQLHRDGFDAVQLSPAQKSAPGTEWYLRYQPFDHLEIEGLGDRKQLTALCTDAARLGITIIADLVFNHMAVPEGVRRIQWLRAEEQGLKGDRSAIDSLYAKLSAFPHLTIDDFQPWRDMSGPDWDNDHRYESWGNGEWPELKPTENVIAVHRRHIEILYESGVRGFRFDAVKHMRPQHLARYLETIKVFNEPCWCYGEVFSGDPKMHAEYSSLFPTTDFPFILLLKDALAQQQPVVLNPESMFLSPVSVRFGLNHDLALNPYELVSGFRFQNDQQTRLANCLALVLNGGTALVYADDYLKDDLLRLCSIFRQGTGGITGPVDVQQVKRGFVISAASQQIILDLKESKLTK